MRRTTQTAVPARRPRSKGEGSSAPGSGPSSTPPPVVPAGPHLYQMNLRNRAFLWIPRLCLAISIVGGIYGLIFVHVLILRILDVMMALFAGVLLFSSHRQMASIVVRAEMEAGNIHFHRLDGQVINIPRRGRAIYKDTRRSHAAMVVLQSAEAKEQVALMRQDRDAMGMLAELERRGVVRGPIPVKPLAPPGALPGGRR